LLPIESLNATYCYWLVLT